MTFKAPTRMDLFCMRLNDAITAIADKGSTITKRQVHAVNLVDMLIDHAVEAWRIDAVGFRRAISLRNYEVRLEVKEDNTVDVSLIHDSEKAWHIGVACCGLQLYKDGNLVTQPDLVLDLTSFLLSTTSVEKELTVTIVM